MFVLNFAGGLMTVHNICLGHALGRNGAGLRTFLPKTGLEQGGFKDTTLNY